MHTSSTTPGTAGTGTYRQNENPLSGGWPGKGQGGSASNRQGQYNHNRRRRPPYAARLAAVLAHPETWAGIPGTSADHRHLTTWVLAGPDAWDTAAHWTLPRMVQVPLFTMLPPGESADSFDWTLLRGHPPILIWPCGDLPRADEAALVAAIIRDGGERVLVLADSMRLYRGGRHA